MISTTSRGKNAAAVNDAIQGLRGIAALLVVADHAIHALIDKGLIAWPSIRFGNLLGGVGVKVFFLISGFIMTTTLYEKFGVPSATRDFAQRRIGRIVPLYWLMTFAAIFHNYWRGTGRSVGEILSSLFFFPWKNGSGAIQPIYGLGWTLNYEMYFYAIFGAALLLKRTAGLLALTLTIGTVCLGSKLLAHQITWDQLQTAILFWGNTIVLFFLGGMVAAIIRIKFPQRIAPLSFAPAVSVLTCCGIIGAFLLWSEITSTHGYFIEIMNSACVGAFVICAFSRLPEAETAPSTRRLLFKLGDASYSIYLTHGMMIFPLAALWSNHFAFLAPFLFVATALIVASLLGMASYRLIERPAMRLLRP